MGERLSPLNLWRWLGLRPDGVITTRRLIEGPRRASPTVEWVLTPEERWAGFRRPLRFTYLHDRCAKDSVINLAVAEALARDPKAFKRVYCWHCRRIFPAGQFVWKGSTEQVGS